MRFLIKRRKSLPKKCCKVLDIVPSAETIFCPSDLLFQFFFHKNSLFPASFIIVPPKRSSHESVTFCLCRKVNLAAFTNCQTFNLSTLSELRIEWNWIPLFLLSLQVPRLKTCKWKWKNPQVFDPRRLKCVTC